MIICKNWFKYDKLQTKYYIHFLPLLPLLDYYDYYPYSAQRSLTQKLQSQTLIKIPMITFTIFTVKKGGGPHWKENNLYRHHRIIILFERYTHLIVDILNIRIRIKSITKG